MDLDDRDRLLVLAPHPDDETLGSGGLIARAASRGAAIRVLMLTDGEQAVWTRRLAERRVRLSAADLGRFGTVRRDEARRALARLGAAEDSLVFWGAPDTGLTSLLLHDRETLVECLARELEEWRPTLVVSPSLADLHPDHSSAAVLLQLAARLAATRVAGSAPEPRYLSYLVHGAPWLEQDPSVESVALTEEERGRKREAIGCYRSQLAAHPWSLPRFAGERERFVRGDAATPRHRGRYSILDVWHRADALRFEVVRRPMLRAFGAARLEILGCEPSGAVSALEARLDWRDGHVPLEEVGSSGPAGRVWLDGGKEGGVVRVRAPSLARFTRIFLKIEHRFGFFDEAGWVPVNGEQDRRADALAHAPALHALAPREARPFACAVVPCFDVAPWCAAVVRETAGYVDHVIAVDDGSTDGTGEILRQVADSSGGRIEVLTLARNRGKGVALLDAFRHALATLPVDVLVTIDGDGQHRPADIPQLTQACREGAALVMGSRTALERMPFRSRLGNTFTGALLRLLFPASPPDTQSGLRALDRRFAERVVDRLRGRRYETELQILVMALGDGEAVASVPIPTVYIDRNRSSHFRPVRDSVRIYAALAANLTLLGPRLPVERPDAF